MDLTELHAAHPAHKHGADSAGERALPVVLLVSLLALSACAAFAAIMSNGPDGRAAAEGVTSSTVDVAAGAPIVAAPVGDEGPDTALAFRATLPSGPLVIGEPGVLVIAVTNPNDVPVALSAIAVTVLPPAEDGCRAEWLSVGGYDESADAPVRIAAHATARVTVPYTLVDLPSVNQDACKGAAFPLSIEGSGHAV